MKCDSLNHFYAVNSVSHLCVDKVTFINPYRTNVENRVSS